MTSTTPSEALARAIARSGLDATDLGGDPATSIEYRAQAEHTVGLLASTLARLHGLDPVGPVTSGDTSSLPVMGPAHVVHRARTALAAGELVQPRSAAYRHLADDRLVQVLEQGAEDLAVPDSAVVLTHGAPTIGHLRCRAGSAIGLVGWEQAALGDPYRDLAVAARSVAQQLTPTLVPVFFERYGELRPDARRLDWYSLATELLVDPGA